MTKLNRFFPMISEGIYGPYIDWEPDVDGSYVVAEEALHAIDLLETARDAMEHRMEWTVLDNAKQRMLVADLTKERDEARELINRMSRALGNLSGSTTLWREAQDFLAKHKEASNG